MLIAAKKCHKIGTCGYTCNLMLIKTPGSNGLAAGNKVNNGENAEPVTFFNY